jgi:Esterase Ig-like N-terminal domain
MNKGKRGMPSRRVFLTRVLGGAVLFPSIAASSGFSQTDERQAGGEPGMQNSIFYSEHIQAATVVTKIFGDGQRLTAVVVEYDTPIKNNSLSVTTASTAQQEQKYVQSCLYRYGGKS